MSNNGNGSGMIEVPQPFPGGIMEITIHVEVPPLKVLKRPPWYEVQSNQLYFRLKDIIEWFDLPADETPELSPESPYNGIQRIATRWLALKKTQDRPL